jgi:hypothetical protein
MLTVLLMGFCRKGNLKAGGRSRPRLVSGHGIIGPSMLANSLAVEAWKGIVNRSRWFGRENGLVALAGTNSISASRVWR